MLNSAEHEFYPAHKFKMPTIVGILTFISMINASSERLEAGNFFICWYLSFWAVDISCSAELSMKKVLCLVYFILLMKRGGAGCFAKCMHVLLIVTACTFVN